MQSEDDLEISYLLNDYIPGFIHGSLQIVTK